MHDTDRFRLLGGPYRAPAFVIGDTLRCELRGHVRVAGVSAAKIPWPQARNGWNGTGRHYLILCGDLAQAVQRESSQAVAHWWGVSITTVWTWRRALKVPQNNDGTRKLRQRWAPEVLDEETRALCKAACQLPEFGAAVSARLKGKVPKQMVGGNRGRKHSAETRAKMSAVHRRQWQENPPRRPWTAGELALLGMMLDREVAERTDRTVSAVAQRREKAGIPPYRGR